MVQDVKKKNEAAEAGKRLQEISEIKFGELSDDEILQLSAERKRFAEMKQRYEQLQKEEDDRLRKEQERLKKEEEDRRRKAEEERLRREKEEKEQLQKEQKEEEKRLALEKERTEITKKRETLSKKKQSLAKEIEELNQAISPAKTDDDLLMLISQRKKLEKELREVEEKLLNELSTDIPQTASVEATAEIEEKKDVKVEKEEKIEPEKKAEPSVSFRESLKKEFGDEEIGEDFPEGGELHRYLAQLKNNTGSLGTLLQEMPANAKKNKAFMLKVAEIDPAYAMHYADKELKKNEDFNVRAASMKNPRNSGNALAEMFPEARTSRVVLAAVKQDYRNVKFIQPNMEDYDEIMRIAKKATLEKLQSLKSAADMLLIIPRPLQQDRQFMIEAKNIMSVENKKSV